MSGATPSTRSLRRAVGVLLILLLEGSFSVLVLAVTGARATVPAAMVTPLGHPAAVPAAWTPKNIVRIEVQNLTGETIMEYQVDSTNRHHDVRELQRRVHNHLQEKRQLELRQTPDLLLLPGDVQMSPRCLLEDLPRTERSGQQDVVRVRAICIPLRLPVDAP